MKIAYLASPYSHPRFRVREIRYHAVMKCVVWSFKYLSASCFSPILYTHEMTKKHKLPLEAGPWRDFNHTFMKSCEEVYILQISGWEESVGVALEISWAKQMEKPLFGLVPSNGSYLLSTL